MSGHAPFVGRSLAVIEDMNHQERLYLYQQARRLKEAMAAGDQSGLDRFRINDPDFGFYEVFLEDSTRTRESFKNAAHFHRMKFSEFNAESSSFNKSESYLDTFSNLVGYGNRIFVVRSRLEGVCRHLEERLQEYRRRHSLPWPVSFINAGDGRHEHPTQELLDEFTFLEDLNWSHEKIHLALVGDLYHGRTVHSKVRGLGLFQEVLVDLVAPRELSMPAHYVEEMRNQGFQVREYGSIAEYLSSGSGVGGVAPQWYFTRPQLERMGDRILRRQGELRAAITFDPADRGKVPPGTRFYHPLPRHREYPTIPVALDDTELNGWERQSANGWIVRIVLLAMLGGRIGQDYQGPLGSVPVEEEQCITELPLDGSGPKRYSEGIRPIRDGLVLDHVCAGDSAPAIREHLATLIRVMELHGPGGEWVSTGEKSGTKGLLFRPGHPVPDETMIRKLAAVVPGATVNVIRHGEVQRKIRLGFPLRIAELPELVCRNEACITHPANGEQIIPRFRRTGTDQYSCAYCSRTHSFQDIWK